MSSPPAVLFLFRPGGAGFRLLLLLLTLCAPVVSSGAEEKPPIEKPATFFTAVDEGHTAISDKVIATAEWLDSFFADERFEAEAQTSQVRLRFSLFAEEGQRADYDVDEFFRLSLPAFNNRLQFQLSGDEEDADRDERVEGGRRPSRERERGFIASVRYFFRHTEDHNVSLRTGVRLRSGLPVLFLEPRYRQDVPGPWRLRFIQRFMGYTDGDLSARTIFDLERPLHHQDEFFFRATAEGLWTQEEPGYSYSLTLALFQKLDEKQVLEYAWGNQFETSPSHRLEDSRLILVYRRKIGWDWLFLEVAPQVGFPYERDRRPTPGIRLQLEALFGARDRKK